MANLVLRLVKGTPLTNAEVDNNFSNINSEVGVVQSNLSNTQSNVTLLQSNVTTIQTSLSNTQSNVTLLQSNITILQSNIINVTSIANNAVVTATIQDGAVTTSKLNVLANINVTTDIFNAGNIFVGQRYIEKANICGYAFGAGSNSYSLNNGVVHVHTANAVSNTTVNLQGFETFNPGNAVSIAVVIPNGTSPFYITGVVIDGTAANVTTRWSGGVAPTSGNASNVDIYSFSVIKTQALTYSVYAQQTQFGS